MVFKLAAVAEMVVVALLAATTAVDGTASRIALFAAAGAGILWTYAHVVRPIVRILARTVNAVEALEELPQWREETDKRVTHLEILTARIHSGQRAIIRELGIEEDVRRTFPTPEDFFGPAA